jgi:hypothetical protein
LLFFFFFGVIAKDPLKKISGVRFQIKKPKKKGKETKEKKERNQRKEKKEKRKWKRTHRRRVRAECVAR